MAEIALRIAFLAITAGFFIFCDSLAADWAKSNSMVSLFIIFSLAPLSYILFGILNRDSTLAVNSGLVNMGIIIGTVFVSIFVFNDEITIRQSIGLITAIISVGLML
jgi:hypothetical protein